MYDASMPKKVPTTIKLDHAVRDRLDKFVARTSPAVTMTAVIEAAVTDWLDRREGKTRTPARAT